MDVEIATRIAELYIVRIVSANGPQLILYKQSTIEREFGWVFFYGPSDPSVDLAGNAPFIVDRKDGSVHVTGTAFPVEQYLDSYDRVGRTYPFAVPEHVVILEGWAPGLLKVSLTKLIRSATGKDLAAAKYCTDEVLSGRSVTLRFPSIADADQFCTAAQGLGVLTKRQTRFL